MIRLRKRSFGTSVLILCNRLIYDLLESDINNARQEIQETIGNHCFDIIRKKGSQEIYDFRKMMIEKVLEIVQSDNPIIGMRMELIKTIQSDILNQTFFSEDFFNRRQELYEALNKYLDNKEIINSDETAGVLFIWNEAESCILRMLQAEYFEEVGKDDWFETYSKSYQLYIKMLFELALSKKDEKDFSVYGVMFPEFKKELESYQQKLVGETVEL